MCEFCGKAQFPQSFEQIVKYGESEIMVFYAVRATADESFISLFNFYCDMDPGN